MSIHIIPFDQASQDLRDAAHEFCRKELTLPEGEKVWNLALFAKAWIAVEDELFVVGVSAFLFRADIAVFRSTCDKATTRMNQRLHSYFADQGLLGQDIFIQFSDKEKDRLCAGWKEEFDRAKLKPADRYLVRVKPI